MKIWIDGDACPGSIKKILFKAAERTGVSLILVANRLVRVPASDVISFIQVGAGADVADKEIIRHVVKADLVITADIPLAAAVVDKGAVALDPRGVLYTAENIGERLSYRDFMDSLRSTGMETGGPKAFTQGDKQQFANQLDRLLSSGK